jgi:hypothetical protein
MRIAIELTDASGERLAQRARQLGVSPQALARAAVEELVAQPDARFEEAASRVLAKNAELYRRLT